MLKTKWIFAIDKIQSLCYNRKSTPCFKNILRRVNMFLTWEVRRVSTPGRIFDKIETEMPRLVGSSSNAKLRRV